MKVFCICVASAAAFAAALDSDGPILAVDPVATSTLHEYIEDPLPQTTTQRHIMDPLPDTTTGQHPIDLLPPTSTRRHAIDLLPSTTNFAETTTMEETTTAGYTTTSEISGKCSDCLARQAAGENTACGTVCGKDVVTVASSVTTTAAVSKLAQEGEVCYRFCEDGSQASVNRVCAKGLECTSTVSGASFDTCGERAKVCTAPSSGDCACFASDCECTWWECACAEPYPYPIAID